MKILKTSEKVLIWLYRENKSQIKVANDLGITRQAFSQKIKDNAFNDSDLAKLKQLGFRY